jgi:recombination protein RecR
LSRIKNDIGIKETIISLSLNREGENTKDIIKAEIQKIRNDIKISELGRGLSTGSEIEYADSATIKSALKNKI